MKISMEGFSFWELKSKENMDLFGWLETLACRYRVRGAGMWNSFFPGQARREEVSGEYADQILRKMRDLELELPNLHCDNCCVCCDDPEDQAASKKYALHMLRLGAKLGAKSVRIDWGVRADSLTPAQEARIVETFREYCAFGIDHGMKVGPENHYGASMNPDIMLRVRREIQSPAYGVLLHLGRWAENLSPEQQMAAERAFAPIAMHCHVDFRTESAIQDLTLENRLRNVQEAGYDGWYGVEHAPIGHTHAVNEALLGRIRLALKRIQPEA